MIGWLMLMTAAAAAAGPVKEVALSLFGSDDRQLPAILQANWQIGTVGTKQSKTTCVFVRACEYVN